MNFKVLVCGTETITSYSTSLKLVFQQETGNPASMASSVRYHVIKESTFKAYFKLNPSGSSCSVYSYAVLSSYTPFEIPWFSSSLVNLVGVIGAFNLKIDKTVVTSQVQSFYLKAETKGLHVAYYKIDTLVCDKNSLQALTISSPLRAIYGLKQTDTGLTNEVVYSASNFQQYF